MRKSKTPHDEATKVRALAIYAETGSSLTASEETGIPRRTIDSWLERDPEIDQKLDALRRAVRERTAHIYAEIASRSAEELLDRVNNGDVHIDKEGKVTRRPVPARELAFITGISSDKHSRLTGEMPKQQAASATLEALAARLTESFNARRDKARDRAALTLIPEPDEGARSSTN